MGLEGVGGRVQRVEAALAQEVDRVADQRLVEEPIGFQDRDPGIDPDQEARPERDHHQGDEERLPGLGRPRHRVGDRVPDEDQQQDKSR